MGVTLHTLISGKRPYDTATDSQYDLETRIVNDPLPPLPGVKPFLQKAIQRATEKDPEKRFDSSDAFIQTLRVNPQPADEATLIDLERHPSPLLPPVADGKKPAKKTRNKAASGKEKKPGPLPPEPVRADPPITANDIRRFRWREVGMSALALVLFAAMGYFRGWYNDWLPQDGSSYRVVEVMDRFGYMNKRGDIVIDATYEAASPFVQGRALVTLNERSFYIDPKGNFAGDAPTASEKPGSRPNSPLQAAMDAQDPRPSAGEDSRIYESLTFRQKPEETPPAQAAPTQLRPLAQVQAEARFSFISEPNLLLMRVVQDKRSQLFGIVNNRYELVTPCEYERIEMCSNGYFTGRKRGGKHGYFNRFGQALSAFEYPDAQCFSEGLAAVRITSLTGLWGYIDTQNTLVIPARYAVAGAFSNGRAQVRLLPGGSAFFIDTRGNCVQNCP